MSNREMKFRALLKNQQFKGWVYFDVMKGHREYQIDEKTLCQYTGLKDKNGKEIYEGDILEGNDPKYRESGGVPSIVKWSNEEAGFVISRGDTSSGYSILSEVNWSTVIGNVHQNPDLLSPSEGTGGIIR